MTLVAPERSSTASHGRATYRLPVGSLEQMHRQICRAVLAVLSDDSTLVPERDLHPVVMRAVEAFADPTASPQDAGVHVGGLLRRVGGEHARRGGSAEDIDAAFAAARTTAERSLPFVLGDAVTGSEVARIRNGIAAYVGTLHQHARDGHERTRRFLAMPDAERDASLRAALFRTGNDRDVELIAAAAGIDVDIELSPVVSAFEPLPPGLVGHPQAIAGPGPYEVLVPALWSSTELDRWLGTCQAVIAPATTLPRISEAVDLARRGAAVLRGGTVTDGRTVVPCTDLAGSLVVDAHPLLAELLIEKRLGTLVAAGRRRRVQLGEFLLAWLHHGIPIARLATTLDLNVQTAHSRMRVIRDLLGEQLDDPMARIELIVALRSALPRWRSEEESTSELQKNL